MAVPTSLASLSTTPGSNPPSGAENPFPELDDHLRQLYAFSAQLRDQKATINNPTFTGLVSLPASTTAVGDGTEFTGVYLKSGRSGGSLHTEFVDGRHANNIPHSSVSMVANTDGSSRVDVRVTSVGSTSADRRALKFRVTDADGPLRFDDASTANGLVRKSQLDSATAQATETARGTLEIATAAEAAAGTDDVRAVTPAKVRSALNASGTAPVYGCRAWGSFNGTNGTLLSGGNLTASRTGTGFYVFTFTTPMPHANYSLQCSFGASGSPTASTAPAYSYGLKTASGFAIQVSNNDSDVVVDPALVDVAVFC